MTDAPTSDAGNSPRPAPYNHERHACTSAATVPPAASASITWLAPEQWRSARQDHQWRAAELLAPRRARVASRQKNPVEDFLWVYLKVSAKRVSTWSPGVGVALVGATRSDLPGASVSVDAPPHSAGSSPCESASAAARMVAVLPWWDKHGGKVLRLRALLGATASRPAALGCFGLHEWAMVYKTRGERRHEQLPLRLTPEQIDEVVESHPIRCTHFDAFRFFTPEAVPLNSEVLTRESQDEFEQPGCLHAGMELLRYSSACFPMVPSPLIADCFEHAMQARLLDMQASPYDVSEFGHQPVRVETPSGRAEYVRRQQQIVDRGQQLRGQLLDVFDDLVDRVRVAGGNVEDRGGLRSLRGGTRGGDTASG